MRHFVASDAKAKFNKIGGGADLQLSGYLERNVRIWVDADKLAETGLTITDVTQALQREHVEMPGGQLETPGRQISIKILGEAADLETLRKITIKTINNALIQLEDVAIAEDGFEDVKSYARADGAPLQSLGILKQRGTNAVAVAEGIRKALDDVRQTLPEGMQLNVLFDTTQFIEESVHHIEIELAMALGLTAIVCWVFLGSFSSTLNVVLAIPMSLLGTVAVIHFCGFTLNTFTLLGLSLAIGLVVDDAVMVMENVFRHAEMGKDRVRAASEGTKEITFAALAATLAVIAIFLPVVFMEGVVGRYFFQFGVTLSVAVAISYVEAITLAPARCAQLLRVGHENRGFLGRLVDRGFSALERGYANALRSALRAPKLVLAATAALLAVSVYVIKNLPGEFVPSQDQSRLVVRLTTSVGSDLQETDKLVKQAEEIALKKPEIERVITTVNAGGGSMTITLVKPEKRAMSQDQFSSMLRQQLSTIPGLRASIQDLSQQSLTGQRGGKPVEFSVRGPDWDKLVAFANAMKTRLNESGLVVDIDSDYQIGLPELQLEPDRPRASALGVSMRDIATTVNALVGGVNVGKYSSAGRRLDVRARLLSAQRSRPEDIDRLRVRAPTGEPIPLAVLVKQEERPVLQAISHIDRERAISIYGNIAPGKSQTEALAFVQSLVKEAPTGYRLVTGGQSLQFQDSISSLAFALLLGIAVAYMILASQFNSFLHPITVLSILPLSIAGAAFALLGSGKTLNIFSMIGVLLLMGIVKKNSIILVDYATLMREEGHDARESMQRAGPVRLRPILMTSIATLMGAIPAALELGPGAETRSPMAIAVIGGLALSTVLSLLVVPAFYVTVDGLKQRFTRSSPTLARGEEHQKA